MVSFVLVHCYFTLDEKYLPFFSLSVIAKETNNFSSENKLGEGGFGPVYKGVLKMGREVAVKRLSEASQQGMEEFHNEVICISKLHHRNLVKLLGYCIQGDERILIYEYMHNRSLDCFIFDETRRSVIGWSRRINIILGIARGLLYLHQDSCLQIIHRVLKASNILLDDDMNPKISDFGLARKFRGCDTTTKTKKVVGTYGYISPEYAVHGRFSAKSDVFSFGVLVLEIVSGKKNREFAHETITCPLRDMNMNIMSKKLTSVLSKACQASKYVSKKGTAYRNQLMEQNKHFVQEPATVAKCEELSKQLFYTRLARFEHLEVLSVAGVETVNDQFVTLITATLGKSLRELNLAHCGLLTDSCLQAIGRFCPFQRSLNVSYLNNLTDLGLCYLADGCKSLETFNIAHTRFSYIGVCQTQGGKLSILMLVTPSNTSRVLTKMC